MRAAFGVALLWVLLSGLAGAGEQSAGELLDEIIQKPGVWDQMCNDPGLSTVSGIPTDGFRRSWAYFRLSRANLERARARRGEMLAVLDRDLRSSRRLALRRAQREALTEREFERNYKPGTRRRPEDFVDPSDHLGTSLALVRDLNGVESLPTLLSMERMVERAARYDLPGAPAKHWGYFLHVQILSTLATILRNEGARGVDAMPENVPYTKTSRDLIAKAATEFLRETKPSEYIGARGLRPVPEDL